MSVFSGIACNPLCFSLSFEYGIPCLCLCVCLLLLLILLDLFYGIVAFPGCTPLFCALVS